MKRNYQKEENRRRIIKQKSQKLWSLQGKSREITRDVHHQEKNYGKRILTTNTNGKKSYLPGNLKSELTIVYLLFKFLS